MTEYFIEISSHKSLQIINNEISVYNLLNDRDKFHCGLNIATHCKLFIKYLLNIKNNTRDRMLYRHTSTLINKCLKDYNTYGRQYDIDNLANMFSSCDLEFC